MDYSQLSDFEINGMVASLTQSPGDHTQTSNETFIHEYADIGEIKSLCIGWKKFAPCNNPSDAWPIIVQHRIGLNFVNENWRAQSLKTGWVEFCNENPLRAAMIVFLMMQESQDA